MLYQVLLFQLFAALNVSVKFVGRILDKARDAFRKPNSGFKRSDDGCYQAKSRTTVVSFCVTNTFAHGNSSGGVFKGVLKCNPDHALLCWFNYGLRQTETKKVVVKFNEVGSELGRANFPASSTQDELMALSACRGHKNAIRLYSTFGEERTKIKIGQKQFWNPGMVIERAEGGDLFEFAKQKARMGRSLDIKLLAAQMNCMFEQLEEFSDFMISKNFFHKDMHSNNIMLSKKRVSDSKGITCVRIKVIDFGVIAKLPTVADKLVGISLYAYIIDFNIDDLLSNFNRGELMQRLAPQERTGRFFLKYLHAAGPYVVENVFPRLKKIGIEYAANPDSYTNFLHEIIANFLR